MEGLIDIDEGIYEVERADKRKIYFGVYSDDNLTGIMSLERVGDNYELKGSWEDVTWVERPVDRIVHEDFLNRNLVGLNDKFRYLGPEYITLENIVDRNNGSCEGDSYTNRLPLADGVDTFWSRNKSWIWTIGLSTAVLTAGWYLAYELLKREN